jgi:hypothetical protein
MVSLKEYSIIAKNPELATLSLNKAKQAIYSMGIYYFEC